MFQLTKTEWACLRLQFETSKGRGGTRYLPYAFTEQGVAMLSGILNSERAIKVNIAIMRAFVQLRKLIYSHKDLAEQLNQIEKKYDEQFKWVFEALRKLIQKEVKPRKRIGYKYYDEGTETG